MEEFVFFIEGNVNHPLTIDPTVWIFDERKVDLTTYFQELATKEDEMTAYKKAISKQWDKEITEGSEPPRPDTNGNVIKYEKQKLIHGSFGMPFMPFLKNSEPDSDAKTVTVVCADGNEHSFPIDEAAQFILGFAKNGSPLREDGPVHVYFGDGSNESTPIINVIRFSVS
ncbi:peptidyl-prolyl cis-trans isomerase [Halalkalibacterium halodurans]|uniref:peptidyl-prolyl cis-trans isomerase n=1 Tax=Halalkalibacterium halodurans TaxID=86665 RepID=UPI002E1B157A|nr:peptidyl-prolyl cis-trans isomerase [Halalkalibacterium halodurans]MED4086288.1 peptidyl-prolyl cis-trans isomerase [Halalkalibacterium halodurans]MED4103367.1 peptidyl-prolyl cis-trans isomerase [Halalkalibacterium halodurans]MED4107936.1 peptidyl-prolyl cis-trans isomerase [Halalkalibacterium halodurans]MED4148239.1 peptidyl-prolyl cis-trans isomerase [Halalkalibacterium halodurans]